MATNLLLGQAEVNTAEVAQACGNDACGDASDTDAFTLAASDLNSGGAITVTLASEPASGAAALVPVINTAIAVAGYTANFQAFVMAGGDYAGIRRVDGSTVPMVLTNTVGAPLTDMAITSGNTFSAKGTPVAIVNDAAGSNVYSINICNLKDTSCTFSLSVAVAGAEKANSQFIYKDHVLRGGQSITKDLQMPLGDKDTLLASVGDSTQAIAVNVFAISAT